MKLQVIIETDDETIINLAGKPGFEGFVNDRLGFFWLAENSIVKIIEYGQPVLDN